MRTYESFTQKTITISNDSNNLVSESEKEDEEECNEDDPPVMDLEPMTPEFYDEIDEIVSNFPKHSKMFLQKNICINSFQDFYTHLSNLFSKQRTFESNKFFLRYIVLPYIQGLKSSANRLINDGLLRILPNNGEIFMQEVVQPIIFDHNSEIYHYELLQRLFSESSFCNIALSYLFYQRNYSLEEPMKK